MALIKRRNKYYARVRWYETQTKQKECQIPLKTSSLTTARTRLKKVTNEEKNIRDGITQEHEFKSKFRKLIKVYQPSRKLIDDTVSDSYPFNIAKLKVVDEPSRLLAQLIRLHQGQRPICGTYLTFC